MLTGFHPRRFSSPQNPITPEQVIHHYPISAGAVQEDRYCPLRHRTSALYFILWQKEFYRAKIKEILCISSMRVLVYGGLY